MDGAPPARDAGVLILGVGRPEAGGARERRTRRAVPSAGLAVAVAAVLVGCSTAGGDGGGDGTGATGAVTAPATPAPAPLPPAAPAPAASATPAPGTPALADGVAPARVDVPAIGLSEPLIDLGIAADGTMEVPVDADDVGWFTGGGRPGGRGPTVIAAHVDSTTGPAVFFRLDELVAGDEVSVTDVEGGVVRYVVTGTLDVAKEEFPTARVFGAQPTDQLRLVTCGGVFDRASGHYDENRVVFAEPVA